MGVRAYISVVDDVTDVFGAKPMRTRSSVLISLKLALCGLVLGAGALAFGSSPAAAHGSRVVLGFSFNSWGPPPPAYYYPPPYYYYPPPPVVYAPAPADWTAQPMAAPGPEAPTGQTCREYQSTVTVGGQVQPSFGTACLQPDGTWRIVN